MMLLEILDALSISITLLFFAVGSYFDLKTREVPDKVWLLYAPLGIGLTVAHALVEPSTVVLSVASAVVAVVVGFGMFYFGLFGGADAKAIFCLGATIPLVPHTYNTLLGYVYPFFPIVVIVMSYLCSVAIIVWLGLGNLLQYLRVDGAMFSGLKEESRWRKVMASITGYRVSQGKLRSVIYLYPMEEVLQTSDGARRALRLYMSAEEDRDQVISKLSTDLANIQYEGEVWATPGLPHMVFLTLGIIITLIVGDPIFTTVLRLAAH